MAKVTLPLMSGGASGKIADALVFFPWKGRNLVRQWLKPANPQSEDQGDQRLFLGGTAKGCSLLNKDYDYYGQVVTLELVPGGQTWISYLVDRIITQYMPNAISYEALVTEFEGHISNAAWDSEAADANLLDFDIEYKGTTNDFEAGLQLYIMAKVAILDGFTGLPYTKDLATWVEADIALLVEDLDETL